MNPLEDLGGDLEHLLIGFHPSKKKLRGNNASKKELMQSSVTRNQSIEENEESKGNNRALNASQHSSIVGGAQNATGSMEDGPINPLDIYPEDSAISDENWVCAAGYYSNGEITCTVPELEEFDPSYLQFNVDMAINGQQFTGQPLKFRYYDIKIKEIVPPNGPSEGGTNLKLSGEGMYDSTIKRIKFSTEKCTREVAATWDRKSKSVA